MPLTVKDILEKSFKRSFKGYDEDEVDRFLDQVIDEMKALQGENEELKSAIAAAKERIGKVSETEETIMNTLISAQKSSERLLGEAARKAELIIDSAQTTARRRVEQTEIELAEAEKHLGELKDRAAKLAESFTSMVSAQSAAFEKTYKSYFGDMETPGGINTEATRRIGTDVETGLKDLEQPARPPIVVPDSIPDVTPVEVPEITPHEAPGVIPPDVPQPKKNLMELHEINQALADLDQEPLNEEGAPGAGFKPKYDDYSWLYDSDDTGSGKPAEPRGKEDLKSLIDDVVKS